METQLEVKGKDVTLVGDSVLLSCLPALQERLPGCVVDAETSRQVWDATICGILVP